jgi:hypothetical protein
MYIKDIQVDILKDMCRVKPKHKVYYEDSIENETMLSIDGYMFCIIPNDMCYLDVNKMQKLKANVISKYIDDVQSNEETVRFTGDVELIEEAFKSKRREGMKLYHPDGKIITYVDRALTKYFDFTKPTVKLTTKKDSTISLVLVYEDNQLVGGVLPFRHV